MCTHYGHESAQIHQRLCWACEHPHTHVSTKTEHEGCSWTNHWHLGLGSCHFMVEAMLRVCEAFCSVTWTKKERGKGDKIKWRNKQRQKLPPFNTCQEEDLQCGEHHGPPDASGDVCETRQHCSLGLFLCTGFSVSLPHFPLLPCPVSFILAMNVVSTQSVMSELNEAGVCFRAHRSKAGLQSPVHKMKMECVPRNQWCG